MANKGHHPQVKAHQLRERIAGEVAFFPVEKPRPALRCCVPVIGSKALRKCNKIALREVNGEGYCGLPEHTVLAYQKQRELLRLPTLTKRLERKYNSIVVPVPVFH